MVAEGHTFRVITHILVDDVVLLHQDEAHQSSDEGRTGKLDEEQRAFPALLSFGVFLEDLCHGDISKDNTWKYATDVEKYGGDTHGNPNTLPCKKVM